jgi:hypothetical protein
MRFVPSLRLRFVTVTLALASLAACGDDGGSETGAETSPATSSDPTSTTTGEPDASTSTATGDVTTGTLDESTGSTAAASSTDDGATTGPTGDPTYPPIDGGACPQGTLPVNLPGVQLCAPFCDGIDDACPPAASGEAVPACFPFAGGGGSGDACDDATPCPDGETCNDGACAEVAFYACQLLCGMGEACPESMACSGIGTCGYP